MDYKSLLYYILMAVINMISAVLNSLLLFMFFVHRRELLSNTHNKILMAIVLACLLVGITGTLNWVLIANSASLDVYKLIGIIPMFSCIFASVVTLCILTCDQLIAVKYSLRYAALVTTRRINITISLSFFLAVGFAINQICIYIFKGPNKELEVRGIAVTVISVTGMLTLAIANYQLYKAIKYQRQRINSLSSSTRRKSQEITAAEAYPVSDLRRQSSIDKSQNNVRKFRTGKMCILLVVVYILNWLPLVVYRITASAGRSYAIPLFRRISMVLASLYQIIVPCYYLLKRRDFRVKMKNLFRK